jgi:hypothetical protein
MVRRSYEEKNIPSIPKNSLDLNEFSNSHKGTTRIQTAPTSRKKTHGHANLNFPTVAGLYHHHRGTCCPSDCFGSNRDGGNFHPVRRLTDTDKWSDPWFQSLPTDLGGVDIKLVTLYLQDVCDLAGVWEFNSRRAAFDLGYDERRLDWSAIFDSLNLRPRGAELFEDDGTDVRRIEKLDGGRKWWITRFVKFHNSKDGVVQLYEDAPFDKAVVKAIRKHKGLEERMREVPFYGKHFIMLVKPTAQGARPSIPSIEVILAIAAEQKVDAEQARAFWRHHQGKGWVHNGAHIRDRESIILLLRGWCKRALPVNGSNGAVTLDTKAIAANKDLISRIDGEIQRLSRNTYKPEGEEYQRLRPEAAEEISRLKTRRAKLMESIS